jgi:hypothetical protein
VAMSLSLGKQFFMIGFFEFEGLGDFVL